MKKRWKALLGVVFISFIVACGNDSSSESGAESDRGSYKDEEKETRESAIDSLSGEEKRLFDAIIIMTEKYFNDPSSIKVMEVGDYRQRSDMDKDGSSWGTDSIVARIQGTNKAGGKVNHYYKIVIVAADNHESPLYEYYNMELTSLGLDDAIQALADGVVTDKNKSKAIEYVSKNLEFVGEVGDFCELGDDYEVTSAEYGFDIELINNAISEYWENKGF